MSYGDSKALAQTPPTYPAAEMGAEPMKAREPRVRSAHSTLVKAQEETRFLVAQLEERLGPALLPPRAVGSECANAAESGPLVELESAFYDAAMRQHGFNERLSELLARLEI